jgi:hypothetical protein
VNRRLVFAAYRALFSVLALLAIVVQFLDLASLGLLSRVNFFSYFTIESNLIGALVLLVSAAQWRTDRAPIVDFVRGAGVVYLMVTFVVFALLLSDVAVETAIPWVDTVLHRLMPIVVLVDWMLDRPATRLTVRQGLVWLTYPLVWITYILVRGAIVGWYPYPFLNPAAGGYGSVAVYVIAILIGMSLVCALVLALGNAGRARHAAMA